MISIIDACSLRKQEFETALASETEMAEFQYNRIKMRLLDEIAPHIDLSDLSPGLKDVENQKLSRSIAAAALQIEAGIVSAEAAAAAVVDGFKDNGIDAIYYDATSKTLFLVQAKWTNSNNSSIDLAGVLKFITGVTDLLSQKKFRFSDKIQSKWNIISEALDSAARILLIIAYPGSNKVDPAIQERIDDFVQGQNDTSDTFACLVVSQKQLFQHFAAEAAPPQIDLAISLAQYGRIEAPLLAFYGQISAVDIAKWYREHGNKLFAGNIRHFVGLASDVNAEISKTLTQQPDSFWYFNNGITILAQDIQRRPGPADKSVGVFDCKRVTVVNGAQTVGTIGRSNISNDNIAVVQARIILVEDPEAQTGRLITRASNTQNRIDARNFVALDPTQERIRSELLLDSISYEYRVGEPTELSATSFDFIDAIIALACSSQQVSYVSMAKAYIGGLYTDIQAAPYTVLFNKGTNSKRLWMLVQLARRIDQSIKSQFNDPSPATRGIIVHGNRFALHCVYKRLEKLRPLSENSLFEQDEVDNATNDIISNTAKIIDKYYEGAYLAPLFKNVAKCTDIRDKLMSEGVDW